VTRKLVGLAVALALPAIAAAQAPQIPNEHASDRADAMVTLHSQDAAHRATHRRGEVVTGSHTRNPDPASRAIRAAPATTGHGVVPNLPATHATPAVPTHKGGQPGNHRP